MEIEQWKIEKQCFVPFGEAPENCADSHKKSTKSQLLLSEKFIFAATEALTSLYHN
jgi:hypothetical protein